MKVKLNNVNFTCPSLILLPNIEHKETSKFLVSIINSFKKCVKIKRENNVSPLIIQTIKYTQQIEKQTDYV